MTTVPLIQAVWPAPTGVCALSTLRDGGVSGEPYRSLNLGDHVGDAPQDVAENRRRLRESLGLPQEPVWLRQVHGIAVADLDRLRADGGAGAASVPANALLADASFTRTRGVVCAILTADCLPVLMTDAAGEVVAAAHAGWRGLAAGVLEATVSALGCEPSRLLVWFGPRIGPHRFEVGAEVRDQFIAADASAAGAFVATESNRYRADLGLLARQRLQGLGVERIADADECTHSHPERYFSHRRDGRTGRQATLIWKA